MNFHETWVTNARARLITAGLAGGNVLKNEDRPSTDDDLPVAHVSVGRDQLAPDGDARTGEVRFVHTTKLGIEVLDAGNNLVDLKAKLAVHSQLIGATLFPDLQGWAPECEGCNGVEIEYQNPPDGDRVTGRVTVVFDLLSRTSWPPSIAALPDLETVSVAAGNGLGATIAIPTE